MARQEVVGGRADGDVGVGGGIGVGVDAPGDAVGRDGIALEIHAGEAAQAQHMVEGPVLQHQHEDMLDLRAPSSCDRTDQG